MLLTVFGYLDDEAYANLANWVFLETRKLIQVFPGPVRKLWNNWELRVLVLVSLTLQLSLLHLGSTRRYSAKTWIRMVLWFSYLSADSVATVALGVISNDQGNSCDCNDSQLQNELTAFWASFLLLHLGDRDTITAYAVQDNELWLRHLLGLVAQFGVALYIFLVSWKANWLSFLTILMFLRGFIKFAERTWVMRLANYDPSFTRPGRRHKVLDKITDKLKVKKHLVIRRLFACRDVNYTGEDIQKDAFRLFKIYRCLFLNQKVIISYHILFHNSTIFLDSQAAWKTIEVELGYAYDVFYTKAPFFFTAWGFIFRSFSFTSILFVFVLFLLKERHKHLQIDLIITCLLLVGAILTEIYAVILLSNSDWPWPDFEKMKHLQTLFAPIRNCCAKLTSKQRWSNSMAQLNLLSLCLKDKFDQVGNGTPKPFANLRELVFNQMLLKINGELEILLNRTHKQVSAELKDLVYNTFREKLSSNSNGFSEEYDNYITDEDETQNVEIYQRIVIWHIATDLCLYTDSGANEPNNNLCREVSKDVSDYMMYILVMCPFVLSTGNAIVCFENTCESIKNFFQEKKRPRLPKANACAMLISEYEASSDSVDVYLLTDSLCPIAVLLAKKLSQLDGKWEILSKFWVENLAYVATLCRGNNHAQQLRKGGEFLTHVWLLIEQFNLAESFQRSQTRPLEEDDMAG